MEQQTIMQVPYGRHKVDTSDHYLDNIQSGVGIGRDVVMAKMDHVDDITSENPYLVASSEDAHKVQEQEKLRQIRWKLEDLEGHERELFNAFLSKHDKSRWLDEQLGFTESQYNDSHSKLNDYVGRLLELKDRDDKKHLEYIISDDVLMNFLEWHHTNLRQMQKENVPEIEARKQEYISLLDEYIHRGDIPAWVKESAAKRLARAEVVYDDGFRTYLKKDSEGYATAAYQMNLFDDQSEIVVGPYAAEETVRHNFNHEATHTIEGRNGTEMFGRGGMYRLFKSERAENVAGLVLNEAIVEHVADTFSKLNSIDDTDPAGKNREGAVYYEARDLLHVLAIMGTNKIDIRRFVAAHFDDGEHKDNRGMLPLDRLKYEIDKAFPGIDVLDKLEACENEEAVYEFTEWLKEHAPKRRQYKRLTIAAGFLLGMSVVSTGFVANNMAQEDTTQTTVQIGGNKYEYTMSRHGADTPPMHDPGQYNATDEERLVTVSTTDSKSPSR